MWEDERFKKENWPFQFYLNDVEMPRYLGAMYECYNWGALLNDYQGGFLDPIDTQLQYHNLWFWLIKWDSSHGRPRSLEAEKVIIFAQEILLKMVPAKKKILAAIAKRKELTRNNSPAEIYEEIKRGLIQTVHVARQQEICFWIKGFPEHREDLRELMRNCSLPKDHPEHVDPPHIEERRDEMKRIIEKQESELEGLV